MKTYPVVEITFSPTGGTKKVADQISCYLGNITNTVNLIRHMIPRGIGIGCMVLPRITMNVL